MTEDPLRSIRDHFGELEDGRHDSGKRHALLDVIIIAICGVVCGADNWVEIADFGRAKETWLRQFLRLPHGIPAHDTFGRVFAVLDAEQFQACFLVWVQTVFERTAGQVIALDGKTVRRSHDRSCGRNAIHLVSAWAQANHLVLGQVKVDAKSNEITAIPELLRLLEIKGCLVTVDAMGCQQDIAEQIVAQGADYLLAVKENQPHLHEDIAHFFRLAQENRFARVTHDYHRMVNSSHGRVEVRESWVIGGEDNLAFLRSHAQWSHLQSIVMIQNQRKIAGISTTETRYFISSLAPDAKRILQAGRAHWGIENSLHWILDVAMAEDDSRVRSGHAAENLALLRRICLNLLKQERTAKSGIKARRLRAGWDNDYLLTVLAAA